MAFQGEGGKRSLLPNTLPCLKGKDDRHRTHQSHGQRPTCGFSLPFNSQSYNAEILTVRYILKMYVYIHILVACLFFKRQFCFAKSGKNT